MNLKRFQIGDVVQVKATTEADYDDHSKNERKLIKTELEEAKLGLIVGLKRLHLGIYNDGHYDFDGGQPPYLQVKNVVTVWLVRFGMLNRSVCVQDEDLRTVHRTSRLFPWSGGLPILDAKRMPWPEQCRKEQSELMQNAPRDEKGRWLK